MTDQPTLVYLHCLLRIIQEDKRINLQGQREQRRGQNVYFDTTLEDGMKGRVDVGLREQQKLYSNVEASTETAQLP